MTGSRGAGADDEGKKGGNGQPEKDAPRSGRAAWTLAERGEGDGPVKVEDPPPFKGMFSRWKNVYLAVFVSQAVFMILLAILGEVVS
jgi:hypothetical protein